MNENNKALLNIINKYGVEHQIKYIQSEFFEFTESVLIYENMVKNKERYNISDEEIQKAKQHIEEEFSDVIVMMKQFQLHYEIPNENVEKWIEFKSKRENTRIKEKEEIEII